VREAAELMAQQAEWRASMQHVTRASEAELRVFSTVLNERLGLDDGWYTLYKEMDRSGDGKVSWHEFISVVRERLPSADEAFELRALWRALDTALTGFVHQATFRAFMLAGALAHKPAPTTQQLQARRSRVAALEADREAHAKCLRRKEHERALLTEAAEKLRFDLAGLKRDEERHHSRRARVAQPPVGSQSDRGHYRTILETEPECDIRRAHYLGDERRKGAVLHRRQMFVNRQLSERFTGIGGG